jgi:hypothetical protein
MPFESNRREGIFGMLMKYNHTVGLIYDQYFHI